MDSSVDGQKNAGSHWLNGFYLFALITFSIEQYCWFHVQSASFWSELLLEYFNVLKIDRKWKMENSISLFPTTQSICSFKQRWCLKYFWTKKVMQTEHSKSSQKMPWNNEVILFFFVSLWLRFGSDTKNCTFHFVCVMFHHLSNCWSHLLHLLHIIQGDKKWNGP